MDDSRITRIERELRVWRTVALGAAAVALIGAASGPQRPTELRIDSANGKQAAIVRGDGISFQNADGTKVYAALLAKADLDAGALMLTDMKSGATVVQVLAAPGKSAVLLGDGKKTRVSLGGSAGASALAIEGDAGERISVAIASKGPTIYLEAAEGAAELKPGSAAVRRGETIKTLTPTSP